jgi:hypothetical protein
MEIYTIIPTSAQSADCDPIVLWEAETRRLVFKPMLVENPNDPAACVNGVFTYQRKRKAEEWEDHNEVPLNTLKAGEWVRIPLQAKEVLDLARHLSALYRFHAGNGQPRRKIHLLKVDLNSAEAEEIGRLDVSRVAQLSRKVGVDVVTQMLEWVADVENAGDAVSHLRQLDRSALQHLGSLAGFAALERALGTWKQNQNNGNEEFWQKEFQSNAFVLAQAFAFPVIIIEGKAYLGGKALSNRGGNLADFLAANPLTRNPVIIEIKTPLTQLLGREYRGGIYPASNELSGAISQVLNYKLSLTTERLALSRGYESALDVFNPHCLVVAGHTRKLQDEDKIRSFELLRASLKDVIVVTYDELFEKLGSLVDMLAGTQSDGI